MDKSERHFIAAEFNIDLADPRLDILSFKLGGECPYELLVFRAVRKKDFHTVPTARQIIAMAR